MRSLLLIFLLLAPAAFGQTAGPTPAATAGPSKPAEALSPAQAQQVLDVLTDDKKRAAFTTVLENMAHGLPATAEPVKAAPLAPDSLGAQVLVQASTWLTDLADQITATAQVAGDIPLLGRWLVTTAQDPYARARLLDAAWKLAIVLACALAVERGSRWGLQRPQAAIERRAPAADDGFAPADDPRGPLPPPGPDAPGLDAPETVMRARSRRFTRAWRSLRRLPYVLAHLVLELIPVALFAAVGNLLLGLPLLGSPTNTKLVVLAVVNAYVVCRVIMCGVRMFVSPAHAKLRLVHCTDDTALFVTTWVRRLALVAVSGFALAEVGLLFGLYRTAHDTLLKIVGLAVHLMLVVIVLEKRAAVASHIRARKTRTGVVAGLLNRIADHWHWIAIFYIIALWVVAAAEIRDGYARLLHFAVVTTIIITVARLLSIVMLGGLDRGARIGPEWASRYPGLEQRANRYYPVLRTVLSAALVVATLLGLLEAWGFGPLAYFTTGQLGERVVSALVTIGLSVVAGFAVWEAVNASIENHLAQLTRQAQIARSARLRTLLPMLRTALMVGLLIVVGLVTLSEIGVNIAPLLAGAGVLGLAIGFGSQKLVQDLITGLFLLLENTMQVGDVVGVGGLTGTVENLSIRTIRLRALDGSVHIIPFSSVSTVTNMTRDFSYAMTDVSVGLDEEPDRVADLLRAIVKQMRDEPRWTDAITADLDVMGVQAFEATGWLLRVRIRTAASQRWAVSREFNRRIKYKFDEEAIQSPLTAYKVQGWLPPGSERPIPAPRPAVPNIERAAE